MTAAEPPRKRGPRVSGPVVPARRDQRIERTPVVRRAGEVRGRTRPPGERADAWASVPDLAVPTGPSGSSMGTADDLGLHGLDATDTSTLGAVADTSTLGVVADTFEVSARSLGDITYDRSVTAPSALPPLPLETVAAEPPTAPVMAAAEVAPAVVTPGPPPRPRRSLLRRRTRVRRVSRVVRRVDAWSVLKVSVIFYALAYAVLLVAGVLLWNLAQTTGTVANIEGFVRELFGLREFSIDGERLYRASWPIGVFLAVAGTGLNVTAAVMFNLITDLVGGVRVTVLEEEVRVVETQVRGRRGRRSTAVPLSGSAAAASSPSPAPSGGGTSTAPSSSPPSDPASQAARQAG